MRFRLPLAFTVLLCTLAPSVMAQQVRWSFSKGDNTIEASSEGIHVNQRRPESTNAYALARAKLDLADAPAWRVTFDVRFGQLRAVGAGVKLGVGDALIGQVSDGADGICVFLGNDWKKVLQPLDARWHHFEFVSDGTTIALKVDGAELHHESVQGTPNTLLLGSWPDAKSNPDQQSEVWLRNVRVQRTLTGKDDGAVDSGSHEVVALPPPISPALYFAGGFDTASLVRETDTPGHPASRTLTEAMLGGKTAGALHVRLSDLTDHDTLRAPDFPSSPTTFDGAKTVLWARGDAHTPALMVEWDERDGTRWIATFPVTARWQWVVLSPKDFHPWLVDADRARLGFRPSQAMSFRMGLDASNTHTAPGAHEYWVAQVGIETTTTAPALPATAPAPVLSALTIPLRPADTNVTCQVGDHLQLTGSVTMQKTFDSCLLVADGAVAQTRTPSIPTDAYAFTWTPQTPGTHTLELRYANLHAKITVRRLLVTAAASPPAVFSGLPATAGADTAVTVVGAGPNPFPLARVDFYFNGKPLAVATTPPFAATLPVEAITKPGTYPVQFIAYDAEGRPFYAHAATVEVPQRVQVAAPRAFTLHHAGDKASLTASVLPGIKVAKVSYSIVHADASHYEDVADVTAAPFSADVDLSRYASGDYWIRAIATSAAGNSYEAWAVQTTLTNTPDDDRKAQEAKAKAAEDTRLAAVAAEGAKRQAAVDHVQSERAANLAVFAPRDGYDEAIFREQLTHMAFYAPELRQGKVGSVHALAVLTVGGEAVTGIPFTVSALVRPGSGQVTLLANAEDDAKIAVQQAAEFCKMRTAPQGWDWSRYDLTVGYDQNEIKSGGPSAGLADAIAILSCSFKLPVDDSVAMTGAVTLQGRVEPVGGVDFKAEAAFRDPFIHTLIVPDGEVSAESLIRLYISQPALCFSRRVVMVHTVDEAAKEAIIGWSHSDYLHEENLVQGGLRHFARGEDALAVAAFKAAHDTDPNNWTPTFWIAMLDLMRQQRQKDAAQATSDANLGIKGK